MLTLFTRDGDLEEREKDIDFLFALFKDSLSDETGLMDDAKVFCEACNAPPRSILYGVYTGFIIGVGATLNLFSDADFEKLKSPLPAQQTESGKSVNSTSK